VKKHQGILAAGIIAVLTVVIVWACWRANEADGPGEVAAPYPECAVIVEHLKGVKKRTEEYTETVRRWNEAAGMIHEEPPKDVPRPAGVPEFRRVVEWGKRFQTDDDPFSNVPVVHVFVTWEYWAHGEVFKTRSHYQLRNGKIIWSN
jgi:hypothetical protein